MIQTANRLHLARALIRIQAQAKARIETNVTHQKEKGQEKEW